MPSSKMTLAKPLLGCWVQTMYEPAGYQSSPMRKDDVALSTSTPLKRRKSTKDVAWWGFSCHGATAGITYASGNSITKSYCS